jgi:hypothetical protein
MRRYVCWQLTELCDLSPLLSSSPDNGQSSTTIGSANHAMQAREIYHRIHPGDNCICNDARRKRRAGDEDTPVRQNEHRRGALAEARDAFLTVLDRYTLADLAKPRRRLSALFPVEPRPA